MRLGLGGGGHQGQGELVVPREDHLGDAGLEGLGVDLGHRLPPRHPDHDVQPREHGLGDTRGVVDADPADRVHQDLLDLQAHVGRVAVARQVHQAGQEPLVGVVPQEQPRGPPLLEVQRRLGDGRQLVGVDREQLVAGERLEERHEVPAAVRTTAEPEHLAHPADLPVDDRDALHGLGVGRGGEQADEAVLADDPSGTVEHLDPDVVEVDGSVHGRAAVGLGDDEQAGLQGLLPDGRRQLGEGDRLGALGAQQAQPAAGLLDQHQLLGPAGLPREPVLPVPEEREVVVGQPVEQVDGLGDLVAGDTSGRLGDQLRSQSPGLGHHARPVGHRAAHVSAGPAAGSPRSR